MMSQKEAVFQAVVNVTDYSGEGGPVQISKEQRSQVSAILVEGFRGGQITLENASEYTDSQLNQYVSSLISNWLRKDTRLNGGTAYVAKNPGSRAGSSDPTLKAMKVLLSTLTDENERAEVQAYIDARLAEIGAAKAKTAVIDFSALPADLAAKFQK